MNFRPDHEDRLLAEAFHPDWETGRTAEFARQAAAAVRRRRALRRSFCAAGVAAVVVLAALSHRRSTPETIVSRPPENPRAATARIQTVGYEIISDDQLLAELRDRPVLVVRQSNGTRSVVVLQPDPAAETLE